MSEMVERVAKAIFASQANDRSLDKVDRLTRESVLMAARAAIEAMREPTEAQCEAGAGRVMEECGEERAFAGPVAVGVWWDMIDEALK